MFQEFPTIYRIKSKLFNMYIRTNVIWSLLTLPRSFSCFFTLNTPKQPQLTKSHTFLYLCMYGSLYFIEFPSLPSSLTTLPFPAIILKTQAMHSFFHENLSYLQALLSTTYPWFHRAFLNFLIWVIDYRLAVDPYFSTKTMSSSRFHIFLLNLYLQCWMSDW